MKPRLILLAAAIAAVSATAWAATPRTAAFAVSPRLSCANCEKKIKSNLRFEKGVKSIDTSIKAQRVTITYDADKTSVDKLVAAFRKIGYEATPAADTGAENQARK